MTATRVLIIEDDQGMRLALYSTLVKDGMEVDTAKTGSSGLRKAITKSFDVILLDLNLPDMSGLTICKQLRADGISAPIIVLTAEATVHVKVSLLDAGASDYLTKPCNIDELLARIRACLRNKHRVERPDRVIVGNLTLDAGSRCLRREGIVIPLRRKEYSILEYLMLHPDSTITRAKLMQYAWNGSEDAWTNTIDVHIKHLRDKVDRPFSQQLITTVHGIGYKLQVPNTVAKIS